MKIQHITIQTKYFKEELAFFETYTDFVIQKGLHSDAHNIVFLAEASGDTKLEIVENTDAEHSGNVNFSIGIQAGDLDELRQRLIRDGYDPTPFISPEPGVRFFCVNSPAGVIVQFL